MSGLHQKNWFEPRIDRPAPRRRVQKPVGYPRKLQLVTRAARRANTSDIPFSSLAERARFELARPFRAFQFSRLVYSTTLAPLLIIHLLNNDPQNDSSDKRFQDYPNYYFYCFYPYGEPAKFQPYYNHTVRTWLHD